MTMRWKVFGPTKYRCFIIIMCVAHVLRWLYTNKNTTDKYSASRILRRACMINNQNNNNNNDDNKPLRLMIDHLGTKSYSFNTHTHGMFNISHMHTRSHSHMSIIMLWVWYVNNNDSTSIWLRSFGAVYADGGFDGARTKKMTKQTQIYACILEKLLRHHPRKFAINFCHCFSNELLQLSERRHSLLDLSL